MILKNIKTLLSEDSFLERNTGVYIITSVFFAFIAYCIYINVVMNSNVNIQAIESIANQSSLIKNSIIMTAIIVMCQLVIRQKITTLNIILSSAISFLGVFILNITYLHTYLLILPVFAVLMVRYIEHKSTDKIYYIIIGFIIVLTNSTFISTIGMGFFKHMQESESYKMIQDLKSLDSPCKKYQCIVFENTLAVNLSEGNSRFYNSNRYKIENLINKNTAEFHFFDDQTNSLLAAYKKDNITTVVIEKEKITMFKNVSITWINFLSIIASSFWVYIGFILLHYHKNRKIRKISD